MKLRIPKVGMRTIKTAVAVMLWKRTRETMR